MRSTGLILLGVGIQVASSVPAALALAFQQDAPSAAVLALGCGGTSLGFIANYLGMVQQAQSPAK